MKKKEKIIGILGGMGPEATIDLYNKIIKLTAANKDQEHLRIIIDNNPKIPDRSMAILKGQTSPLNALQETALNLEKAGADFIIMPCNTAHYYISSLKSIVNIPVLNMIEETAKEINSIKPKIKKVGLLATDGTIKTKLYFQALEKYSIKVILPEKEEQKLVMLSVYNMKAGKLTKKNKKSIVKIVHNLILQEAEAIIAGCTEIPIILEKEKLFVPMIDPTLILAKASILYAGGNIKKY